MAWSFRKPSHWFQPDCASNTDLNAYNLKCSELVPTLMY